MTEPTRTTETERVTEPEHRPELTDAPPLLGAWRNVYAVVLGVLVFDVVVFFALTRIFS